MLTYLRPIKLQCVCVCVCVRGGHVRGCCLLVAASWNLSLLGASHACYCLLLPGHSFLELPSWVRLLLTSRPQTEAMFNGWKPKWIEPQLSANLADLRLLLHDRLQHMALVPAANLEQATDLLLEKSEGQFIYSRCGCYCHCLTGPVHLLTVRLLLPLPNWASSSTHGAAATATA